MRSRNGASSVGNWRERLPRIRGATCDRNFRKHSRAHSPPASELAGDSLLMTALVMLPLLLHAAAHWLFVPAEAPLDND